MFNFSNSHFSNFIISAAVLLLGIITIWYIIRRIKFEMGAEPELRKRHKMIGKVFFPITALLIFIALQINLSLIFSNETLVERLGQVLSIFIIIVIAWFLINAINILRVILTRRFDLTEKDNLRARKITTQFRVIQRILVFVIIFVAIAAALMTFSSIRRLGVSLFASAGVAGIILGLAAQKGIGTILAGFQIAVTQPIRLDDVVIVEGEWGWIEEITLTYVVVRIWDKRRLVVPTTYFLDKPFENWTRNSADIFGTVFLYTDYHIPVDKLREELNRILKTTDLWDGNVANVQVTDAKEQSLEIRIMVSAADSPTAWDLRVYVREKMIDFLQKKYPDNLPRTRVEMYKGDEKPI